MFLQTSLDLKSSRVIPSFLFTPTYEQVFDTVNGGTVPKAELAWCKSTSFPFFYRIMPDSIRCETNF